MAGAKARSPFKLSGPSAKQGSAGCLCLCQSFRATSQELSWALHVCMFMCVYVCTMCVCLVFSFPAFIRVAGEIKGRKPWAGHCKAAMVVDCALQVLCAFVSMIFKTPFQPHFPLITALLAAEPNRGPRQWSDWRPACGALTSCCSALLILFSCYENTTPPRQGGKECQTRVEMEDYLSTLHQAIQIHSCPECQPFACSELVTSA